MNGELRFDVVMKRIDVYSRLAYGGQCVAAMALIAAPILLIAASIAPWMIWGEDHRKALSICLSGIAAAIVVGLLGGAVGVFCWRWSGDWITEWPGYAVAFAFAAVANGIVAYMLTSTDVPIPLSFALAMAALFLAGFLVAGHLGGMRVLPEQREGRPRSNARRR